MPPPRIQKITFGRNASPFGIGQARPTISWRFASDDDTDQHWIQSSYELSITRDGHENIYSVKSSSNVEEPWPRGEADLQSRASALVKVRVPGGQWTSATVEAALLDPSDWSASFVGPDILAPSHLPKRPFYLRKFITSQSRCLGRVYATALGVYEISVNGKRLGDHVLAPGWQSYKHRLHYQTFEVQLEEGQNLIEAVVGEGWWAGRLSWYPDNRNVYGDKIGLVAQIEVDGKVVAETDESWEWSYGPILSSELYNGETYDISTETFTWRTTSIVRTPCTKFIAPEAPPIRRIQTLTPVELITSPSGQHILDFGQNFVGWVKIESLPAGSRTNESVTLRFAEVLVNGELGTRPLRTADATDKIYLGDKAYHNYEPTFTTHGFRYCEVNGPDTMLQHWKTNFIGIVVHSDMERIGDFSCSHKGINQLHQNVVWGLRGNFVGLPTDCPQRDERLGWTGDLQAFTPTASLLYDTSGLLANWLHDLSAEQLLDHNGVVPLVVPNALAAMENDPLAQAIWGDVCAISPKDLYQAYGSKAILAEMWESIETWIDRGVIKGDDGLWLNLPDGFQLSDWLDPRAHPDDPGAALTDQYLVADAYLVGVVDIASNIAAVIGNNEAAKRYRLEHSQLRKAFQYKYLAPSGRLSSDTQTAYTLAFQFKLLDDAHVPEAAERLSRLVTRGNFKIGTGFAGTPGILHALTEAGHLQLAYRMLQEKGCPSWLYPVTMGATTVWERWDSLLPDGTINPGEMTSFNHYALGAVANWMHTTIGGLAPLDPGYRRFVIQPRPGGTLTSASVHTITPSGLAMVSWRLMDGKLSIEMEIPPNTTAILRLGGPEETLGSGKYRREVSYDAGAWPPKPYQTKFTRTVARETFEA